MRNYNILEDDEFVIGKVGDVKEKFLDEMKLNLEVDEPYNDIKPILDMFMDLFDELDHYSDNEIVKVTYNPMGVYEVEGV